MFIAFWVFVLTGTVLLFRLDGLIDYHQRIRDFAYYLSISLRHLGDFRDTVFYTLSLLAGGWILRRRTWRTFAVAVFLSACLSGITTNLLRFTTGRPRPKIEERTGWVGPTFRYRFQSFPSGHTGTSMGMSTALLLLYPPLGLPAMAGTAGIAWASIHTRNHFPSDLFFGGAVGVFWGVLSAEAARRTLRGRRPSPVGPSKGR